MMTTLTVLSSANQFIVAASSVVGWYMKQHGLWNTGEADDDEKFKDQIRKDAKLD
jgi:hypothetical protein